MAGKRHISIKETLNKYMPNLNNEDIIYQVLIAILVGILSIYILLKIFRSRSSRASILLMGLCEAGKTQIFSELCYGYGMKSMSVTSIKESSAPYKTGKKELTIYDLPGHERIRYSIFEKVKTQARAILFIIDSATIQKDIRDVAEFLYNVLCDGSIQNGLENLLIVCNKQDCQLAKSKELIKTTLEKEMDNLRVTKSSQLKSVGDDSKAKLNFLGSKSGHFEFSQLKPIKIDFMEFQTNSQDRVEDLKTWINSIV